MPACDDSTLPVPEVPGVVLRPVRGEQDAEGLCAVHAARAAVDRVDPLDYCEDWPSLDFLRVSAASELADCDLAARERAAGEPVRWLVVESSDGAVVGYAQIASWREDDGTWVYLHQGWVVPDWRGRGIGTALLQWCEGRIRALAAAEHSGERWEYAGNASSTEGQATALLLAAGYAAPYTVLSLALPPEVPLAEAPVPVGIEVRPAQPDERAAIALSIVDAYALERVVAGTVKGRYDEAYDPVAYAEGLAAPRHDPSLWRLAWAGDLLVGQALTRISGASAEVFEMSVRPGWRRRGVAHALLTRALGELRARGIVDIRVHTVREFPTRAMDVYQSVGFRLLKTFPRYRKAGK
jgi:mycothiol synthase